MKADNLGHARLGALHGGRQFNKADLVYVLATSGLHRATLERYDVPTLAGVLLERVRELRDERAILEHEVRVLQKQLDERKKGLRQKVLARHRSDQ